MIDAGYFYISSCITCKNFCLREMEACKSPRVIRKAQYIIETLQGSITTPWVGKIYLGGDSEDKYLSLIKATPLCRSIFYEPREGALSDHIDNDTTVKDYLDRISGNTEPPWCSL
jgi:hypothetical protein